MPDPNEATRKRTSRIWMLVWPVMLAATIFMASMQSEIAGPPGIPFLDKISHTAVFGLLATLILRFVFDERRLMRTAIVAAAITSLYGISDEFRQSFTPGRSVEFADWVADTFGAVVAAAAYAFWPAWRRLLEMRFRDRSPAEGVRNWRRPLADEARAVAQGESAP